MVRVIKDKSAIQLKHPDFRARIERYADLIDKVSDEYRDKNLLPPINNLAVTQTGSDLWAWGERENRAKYEKELGQRLNTLALLRGELEIIRETFCTINEQRLINASRED